jgi:hypothetical protein
MESPSLPSGRVLKSPFSSPSSPYPYSPLLSAYESRLSPNTYRNIPRIDTNVQYGNLSSPAGRAMRTPVSVRRSRRNQPLSQPVDSPIEPSPVTPVGIELEFPIILDPMTPPLNYNFGMTQRLESSSKEAAGSIRTGRGNESLKRTRAPSRQNSRSQESVPQQVTSAPRVPSLGDMMFLLPSTVFDPNQVATASTTSGDNETNLPNKRSRRQRDVDLDEYRYPPQFRQQSRMGS